MIVRDTIPLFLLRSIVAIPIIVFTTHVAF